MSVNSTYETATHTKTITEKDIALFAELTDDRNPLHLNESYVEENTNLDGCIAHGMLVASTISAALSKLDGEVLYVDQDLNFKSPVYPGDTVVAEVIFNDNTDSKFETLDTVVTNEDDMIVIEGKATILRR